MCGRGRRNNRNEDKWLLKISREINLDKTSEYLLAADLPPQYVFWQTEIQGVGRNRLDAESSCRCEQRDGSI